MTKPKKPSLSPLYGAAFGFNTDRRVKPVHFATGFFVSLLGKHYIAELMNNVVAFADGGVLKGNYALPALHSCLKEKGIVSTAIGERELHTLRKHLRCLANNDEAVYPAYGDRDGFGCDYTTASQDILTRTRDNDGFSGYFVRRVLEQSKHGKSVIAFAEQCLKAQETTLHQLFQPLADPEYEDVDVAAEYEARFGPLENARLRAVAKRMTIQTEALNRLCSNLESLVAPETKLRFLIIGLGIWLFNYVITEALAGTDEQILIFADLSGDSNSRLRAQSRWSYSRIREELGASFARFATDGRFDECEAAWLYVEEVCEGRPKFEEFYRELALRTGLAQPRGGRVQAKHFEPQADTLRTLLLSLISVDEGPIPLPEFLERMFNVWSISVGGRAEDASLLRDFGYSGLDQDHDLSPNTSALIDLLVELGLATRYSDGLVTCHAASRF